MPRTALYPVPKKIRRFCALQLNEKQYYSPTGPLVTQPAFAGIKKQGKIYDVEGKWSQLNVKGISLSYILIREKTKNKLRTRKVLLTNRELRGLAEHFELPPRVLAGAFFRRPAGHSLNESGGKLPLKPSWSELLDPRWKEAFLRWIVGKGEMPTPSAFAWEIFLKNHITFPALPSLLPFKIGVYQVIKGKFVLSEVGGQPHGSFHYRKNRLAMYELRQDKVRKVGHSRKDWGTFNPGALLELLGPKPGSGEYCFVKKAMSKGISLGNIKGETFIIAPTAERPLTPGKFYFIKVIRHDSALEIECYKISKRKTLYGVANIDLIEGLPTRWSILMKTPEK